MSTYRIVTEDTETLTQLTQENLKGVFTYLNLVEESMCLKITLVGDVPETPIYTRSWDDVSLSADSLLSEDQPSGLSIRYLGSSKRRTYHEVTFLYCSVKTSNLDEFKHGFNLIQSITQESYGYYSFGLFDSATSGGYTLFSPLSEFPLLELPEGVLETITSYYPCDWHLVNKKLHRLVQYKTILDPRYIDIDTDAEIPTLVSRILSDPSASKEWVQACVQYVQVWKWYYMSDPFAKKILSHLVHMEVVDIVLERLRRAYPNFRDAILFVVDEIFNDKIVRYLVDNEKYSDILYFDVADDDNIRNASAKAVLLEHDFELIDPVTISMSSEYMVNEYTKAIIRRGGKVKKGPTNPKTGTTVDGYSKGCDMNVSEHLLTIITRMPQLALNNIDLIEDDRRISRLINSVFVLGDVTNLDLLEKIYRKIFTSHYISGSEKTTYLDELVTIHAPKYGYTEEFLNRIRSIEWSSSM